MTEESYAEYERALGELARMVNEDDGAHWCPELVDDVLTYNGAYVRGAGDDAEHLGTRVVIIMDAARVRAEQRNADGDPVWRTAGTLGDVVERLRTLARPGDPKAPAVVLPEADGGHAPGAP
ncbi:hypothetical protein [Amycolatopsis sp. CA-128772]|uniref:hypothetical protein n=1 Tax=Amycolatopsis sp. CA-128772 TaxID=2073159 RepID=UPI0011B035C2|nr:hypothetical protein [Amycolatopsis sp. CA-128772]